MENVRCNRLPIANSDHYEADKLMCIIQYNFGALGCPDVSLDGRTRRTLMQAHIRVGSEFD